MAVVPVTKSSWLNRTKLLEFDGVLFWDQTQYPSTVDFTDQDTYIQLTDTESKRIDLVAYRYYGDSELMWILMLANDKELPNQFLGGETIRIPSRAPWIFYFRNKPETRNEPLRRLREWIMQKLR